jgi:hypothetical protein
MSPATQRRLLVLLAASAAVAAGLFLLVAVLRGEGAVRARQVLTFAVIAEALAAVFAPLFAAEQARAAPYRRAALAAAAPAAWVFLAAAPGELFLALGLDRGALGGLVVAKLVALAAGLAAAGLVLALVRLGRKPLAAVAAAGALALLVALQPFYTRPAVSALRDRPAARDALIAAALRAPELAVAYAFVGAAEPAGWAYVPHTSAGLYNRWVGTDYPFRVPSPWRYLAEYLAAAVALGALAALGRPAAPEPAPGSGPAVYERIEF